MNVIEIVLAILVPVLCTVVLAWYINKALPELVVTQINEWIGSENNQEQIRIFTEGLLAEMKVSTKAVVAGMLSGVSRGAKSVEGQLQHQALAEATGNPVMAGIVSKYIGKYPLLGAFITQGMVQGSLEPPEERAADAPKMA